MPPKFTNQTHNHSVNESILGCETQTPVERKEATTAQRNVRSAQDAFLNKALPDDGFTAANDLVVF